MSHTFNTHILFTTTMQGEIKLLRNCVMKMLLYKLYQFVLKESKAFLCCILKLNNRFGLKKIKFKWLTCCCDLFITALFCGGVSHVVMKNNTLRHIRCSSTTQLWIQNICCSMFYAHYFCSLLKSQFFEGLQI